MAVRTWQCLNGCVSLDWGYENCLVATIRTVAPAFRLSYFLTGIFLILQSLFWLDWPLVFRYDTFTSNRGRSPGNFTMNICMMLWALDFVFLAAAYHYVRLNSKGGWECFSSVTGYRPARWVAGLLYGLFFIAVAVIGIISTHTILSHMWHTRNVWFAGLLVLPVRDARGRCARRRDRHGLALGHPGGLARRERAARPAITRAGARHGHLLRGRDLRLVATELLRRVLTLVAVDMCGGVCVLISKGMLSGPRLDPFSARLHAIHQKGRTFNPPPHEEHEAQGVLGEEADTQEIGECAAADEPTLDLAPVEVVDTGCADCGGVNASSSPVGRAAARGRRNEGAHGRARGAHCGPGER